MAAVVSAPVPVSGAPVFCRDNRLSDNVSAGPSRHVAFALPPHGARCVGFILLSIALHATFLLSHPGTASRSPYEASLQRARESLPIEVRLRSGELPRAQTVESEWKPLQPLARQNARRQQMMKFVPFELRDDEFDESAYLPTSQVTLRPSPATPVAVPYPDNTQVVPATSAKVLVFIDEDGTVAKVRLAKDQAPTPFALSAKATFEHVRYHPALIDRTPVKVRVVVVVTFEDRQAKS